MISSDFDFLVVYLSFLFLSVAFLSPSLHCIIEVLLPYLPIDRSGRLGPWMGLEAGWPFFSVSNRNNWENRLLTTRHWKGRGV